MIPESGNRFSGSCTSNKPAYGFQEAAMTSVIGWDVGGAHLKAARVENGRVVDAAQVASPLRFGLERLVQSFAEAKARIGTADRHAVTMTGELADLFASRREGV